MDSPILWLPTYSPMVSSTIASSLQLQRSGSRWSVIEELPLLTILN